MQATCEMGPPGVSAIAACNVEKPEANEENAPSFGSIGHPHSCSLPCKYMCKRNGCREGVRCVHCHLCKWQSKSAAAAAAAAAENHASAEDAQKNVTLPDDGGHDAFSEETPGCCSPADGTGTPGTHAGVASSMLGSLASMGSFGHPHSCGVPCKYLKRKLGCRNGAKCVCCHLCQFVRPARANALAAIKECPLKPHRERLALSLADHVHATPDANQRRGAEHVGFCCNTKDAVTDRLMGCSLAFGYPL